MGDRERGSGGPGWRRRRRHHLLLPAPSQKSDFGLSFFAWNGIEKVCLGAQPLWNGALNRRGLRVR